MLYIYIYFLMRLLFGALKKRSLIYFYNYWDAEFYTTYKVVISVCLFVCPIITQVLWTDLPQTLIGEHVRPTGIFLPWFWDCELSGSSLTAKI